MNLEVREGATIRFLTDAKAYQPFVLTRFEGVELMGFSPLIYARNAVNVAVTGEGTLDGQASPHALVAVEGTVGARMEAGDGQPAPRRARSCSRWRSAACRCASRRFGEDRFLRPQFIQPYRCKNVLIEGVTIRNSPMWEIHPVLCRNVTCAACGSTPTGRTTTAAIRSRAATC